MSFFFAKVQAQKLKEINEEQAQKPTLFWIKSE